MSLVGTYSHTCVDSLVRVSRRVIWNLFVPVQEKYNTNECTLFWLQRARFQRGRDYTDLWE